MFHKLYIILSVKKHTHTHIVQTEEEASGIQFTLECQINCLPQSVGSKITPKVCTLPLSHTHSQRNLRAQMVNDYLVEHA